MKEKLQSKDKCQKIKTKKDEFSEKRVFESKYQDGLRVWDPEQKPKPRNSFIISHKNGVVL
jgi:hypothetical protein